jgi:outer membrane lipoprotein SlyB
MRTQHKIVVAAWLAVSGALLQGCASPSPGYQASNISSTYGTIDSIQIVQVASGGNTSGVGAVTGGVLGGVLGHQIGHGTGNAAATVAGAVGGALLGNSVEQNNAAANTREMYQINVRMDNGSYQSVTQDAIADLRVGDRVHIENNRVYHG